MPRPKSNVSPTRAAARPSTPIHDTIDSMVQGVSQQPSHLRLPGQGEEQQNGWSSVVEGLVKRNPAMLQLLFSERTLDNFYLEMFQLGPEETYAFLLFPAADYDETKNLNLVVRNTTGTAVKPDIHGPGLTIQDDGLIIISESSYLWSEAFDAEGRPQLFRNYSLINTASGVGSMLNRTKTVEMSDEKTPERENVGLVFVQGVVYQAEYKLTLLHNGTTYSLPPVQLPAATDNQNKISTSETADRIAQEITNVDGFIVEVLDYIIKVKREDGEKFEISMDDSRSNTLAIAFTDQVGALSDLPTKAPNGYIVNINSDPAINSDDRWVKFTVRNQGELDGNQLYAIPPSIPLILEVDQEVTCPEPEAFGGEKPYTFEYFWRNSVNGNDTAGQSFTPTSEDVGVKFSCRVKVTSNTGSEFVFVRSNTATVQAASQQTVDASNQQIVEASPSSKSRATVRNFLPKTGIGEGSWAECTAPDIIFKLNDNTLPYHVKRDELNNIFIGPADGETRTIGDIEYEFPEWGTRSTGTEETTPNPDIVDKVIRDHAFFRERYILAGGEVVQFSEVGDAYNFFQDSVLSLTDQDAFAAKCVSEVSSSLEWVLPIDENLLVWSSTSQFQIRSADSSPLNATSVVSVRLSNIVMNRMVKPKLAAAKVIFSTDEYGFSHVREFDFFSNRQARLGLNLGGSNDITLNLPKYIKGMITHWDVSESSDYAVARTAEDPKSLYVYKYQWTSAAQGLQKIQASWSKWTFNGDVQWVKFMQNNLWLVTTFPNRTELHILQSDELVSPEKPQLKLDRQLLYPEVNEDPLPTNNITGTYDALENTTTFQLPYAAPANGKIQAVTRYATDNDQNEGLFLGETTSNVLVCSQRGDWRNAQIAFGEPYQFRYEFNKGYVEEANQTNTRRIGKLTGRTQVLTWEIHHKNTGFYKVRVKRKNRSEDSVSVFRARTTGVDNNLLTNEQSFMETGSFKVPVYSRNVDCSIIVESDSWLPVTVSAASWEGTFSDRSKG